MEKANGLKFPPPFSSPHTADSSPARHASNNIRDEITNTNNTLLANLDSTQHTANQETHYYDYY